MLSCSIHQSDQARMAISNVSFAKGMFFALACAKWTWLRKSGGESDRAMRKVSWSGSNPTVKLDAFAYFHVNRPSPHPISSTCLSLKSTNRCSAFRSNPSGSFCMLNYFESFFILLTDSVTSSFKTFLSTSSSFLTYKHPMPVLYLPSFLSRSSCTSNP